MAYRIGLIGNRAHQNTFGPVWHNHPDCEIVAAAEHNVERGRALTDLYGVDVDTDYDAVLENPDVDIVSICTDFYLKRPLIQKAVAHGKHVLVDKPLGRTATEAQENCECRFGRACESVVGVSVAVYACDDAVETSN